MYELQIGWSNYFPIQIDVVWLVFRILLVSTSSDGGVGTDAAHMSFIDGMELPVRVSLAMVISKLKELKERTKVNVSGKMINATELA